MLFLKAFFDYHLGQLRKHVDKAVTEVKGAKAGQNSLLATQLEELLADDGNIRTMSEKTEKALKHLQDAKNLLDRDFSREPDLASWLDGKANGGVVCAPPSLFIIPPNYLRHDATRSSRS